MKYSEQLQAAKSFIQTNDHFLVVSHVQPDGDAISSTCAVGYLLDRLKKNFVMINEDSIPEKFGYLPQVEQIQLVTKDPQHFFKHIIAVDCADLSRMGQAEQLISPNPEILNIDHHPTNNDYGQLNLVEPSAAATAEILYDLYDQFDLAWDQDFATCIYTGILTDTGGFRYANTTAKLMNIAADLLRYGVNAHEMAEKLLEKRSYNHLQLLGRALNTLSFTEDRRVSWVALSEKDIKETNASIDDYEGIVHYPRNIDGVDVGILFREVDSETVKISLRSSDRVNVSEIAKFFNGGGHVRAAGATLKSSLSNAVSLVINKVKKELS